MLGCPSQYTWERGGVPDRLDGILCLASLKSHQPLGMTGLDELDLLHFHLHIVDFLVERCQTRIHARMD